jgi:hypothetical protein
MYCRQQKESQKCNTHSVSEMTYGFATVVTFPCSHNAAHRSIVDSPKKEKSDKQPTTEETNNLPNSHNNSSFFRDVVNYQAIIMMYHLGMLLGGLRIVSLFLGIASSYGNKPKWKQEEEIVGNAIHNISESVMTQKNIEE